MKIIINENEYRKISNLKFDPETDIIGSSLPVNEFSADIYTDDDIPVGVNAYLEDDDGNLWAKYWIIRSERRNGRIVSLVAQSIILLLDRFTMPAKMYTNVGITTAISEVFATISAVYPTVNLYTIDSDLLSVTYTGYAPEQTARERLLWLVFVAGAYVKTYFTATVDIKAVNDLLDQIPMAKTFWKPSISFSDYVTKVSAKAYTYTYTQEPPQATDTWVEINGAYYLQEEQSVVLSNPAVPVTATENVISFDDITLINLSNVDEILTKVSTYFFQRMEVDADVINNGEYIVGRRYLVNTDENNIVAGYVRSASFSFGKQARSRLKLIQTETIDGVTLTIEYMYGRTKIGSRSYFMPKNYNYSIENPYVDYSMDAHRYIFYPINDNAEGTILEEDMTDTEEYEVAIDFDGEICAIYDADDLDLNGEVLRIK